MALCVTPLPDELKEFVRNLCQNISDKELKFLATTVKGFLIGGFRADNVKALRTRLEQFVLGTGALDPKLREFLFRHSRFMPFLSKLSKEHIDALLDTPGAIVGGAEIIATLLLSDKEEIRTAAEERLKGDIELTASMSTNFSNVIDRLNATINIQEEAMNKAAEELKVLRSQTAKVAPLEKELAATKAKLAAELSAHEELKASARELKVELERERNHRELCVAAEVDKRLSEEFSGWLLTAKATEAAARASSDVLEVAEAALEKQAAMDRNSGNRRTLSQRLTALRAKLAEVDFTLADTFRKSPELSAVRIELSREISSIQNTLSGKDLSSPLARELQKSLEVGGKIIAEKVAPMLDHFERIGMLSKTDRETLEQRCRPNKPAYIDSGEIFDKDAELDNSPSGLLSRALRGRLPMLLLIDGHNAYLGLPSRYQPPRGVQRTEAQKRDMLVRDIDALVAPFPALRAHIVFDGSQTSDNNYNGSVRVSYSGGTGEHRADNFILDLLRYHRNKDTKTTILLVSDDRDFCRQSERLGAKTIRVQDFGTFLPSTSRNA